MPERELLEQPRGMPSEEWITILLRTALDVTNGIDVSELEEGRPADAFLYKALADDINDALSNPVLVP